MEGNDNPILYPFGDYDGVILDDNCVIVYYRGEEVFKSRSYRLRVQAEKAMRDFIKSSIGTAQKADITLDVQGLSIDVDSLLGGKHNG